jgi:hypothetical protein
MQEQKRECMRQNKNNRKTANSEQMRRHRNVKKNDIKRKIRQYGEHQGALCSRMQRKQKFELQHLRRTMDLQHLCGSLMPMLAAA